MANDIMAPCQPDGEVNSLWSTDGEGGDPGLYAFSDDDSKDAECRCRFGTCCVNNRNKVITGIVLTVGGPRNLK